MSFLKGLREKWRIKIMLNSGKENLEMAGIFLMTFCLP